MCKLERHRNGRYRGYIGMLVVDRGMRGCGLGTALAEKAIRQLLAAGAEEIVLETEQDNSIAVSFYMRCGFVPVKHLHRYYLNGKDAYRLQYAIGPFTRPLRPSHGNDYSDWPTYTGGFASLLVRLNEENGPPVPPE